MQTRPTLRLGQKSPQAAKLLTGREREQAFLEIDELVRRFPLRSECLLIVEGRAEETVVISRPWLDREGHPCVFVASSAQRVSIRDIHPSQTA